MRHEDNGQRDVPFEWLTFQETCRYLRISEPTLRRMLRNGGLSGAVKVGSLWRFHRATLDEALLSQRGAS